MSAATDDCACAGGAGGANAGGSGAAAIRAGGSPWPRTGASALGAATGVDATRGLRGGW